MTTITEPQGLMAFTATISPPSYVLCYQQWHNCEHIPERVQIPGFLEGRRYRLFPSTNIDPSTTDAAPRFLMFYHTTNPSILSSPAYHSALSNPTPWTLEALSHFGDPIRDIYSLISSHGARGAIAAPYIVSLRFDFVSESDPSATDGLERAYADKWLPKVVAHSNVQRARFYRADKVAGAAATNERAQHGGGPGTEGWLVLVELKGPPAGEDDDVLKLADEGIGEDGGRVNETREMGWLEMVHVKQE